MTMPRIFHRQLMRGAGVFSLLLMGFPVFLAAEEESRALEVV